MTRISIKRKFLLISVALLFVVAAVLFTVFGSTGAKAEGNEAGDASSATQKISLEMDVNGINAGIGNQDTLDSSPSAITANNGRNYKTRVVTATAAVDWYASANQITGLVGANYNFVADGIIKDSNSFDVSVQQSVYIVVTANELGSGRFTVDLVDRTNANNRITVTFSVGISGTLAPIADSGVTSVRVGGKVVDGVEDKSERIWSPSNFSDFVLNLEDRLKGRALYYGGGTEPSGWNTLVGIPGDETKPRVISSVEHLSIVTDGSAGDTGISLVDGEIGRAHV